MPFDLPNLDDKTYADLVAEARASIPRLYPGWTDHNASDPGIALIELFAWLAEMMVYRTNRVPDRSKRAFLALLNGAEWSPPPGAATEDLVRTTLTDLRERFRAVTPEDYEYLTSYRWPSWSGAAGWPKIKRVRCLGERDVSGPSPTAAAPGHVSLIVAPESGVGTPPWVAPAPELLAEIAKFFDDRRLITTRLHVAGPRYVDVSIAATLYLEDDAVSADVDDRARKAIVRLFDPWSGGADGEGWPFGRDVHASEVYALLDQVPGVEMVDTVLLDGGAVASVALRAHELARVQTASFTLKERRGGQWQTING